MAVLAVLIPCSAFSQSSGAPSAASGNAPVEGASAPEQPGGPRPEESSFVIGEESPGGGPAGPSSFFIILRMVLVLALVAALIYLVVFFLRRLSKPQAEQNPHLKILASTHLGGGRYVHVVAVGNKAWLIGAGEGGVRHIADITDQEAVDAMVLSSSEKSAETSGFNAGFQALLQRLSGGERPPEDRLENIRKRRERFKRF